MTGKYNEVMDRLKLSEEAMARILGNVMEHAETESPRQGKIIQVSSIRRYAAVAACLAVVLLAVFSLPQLQHGSDNPPEVASTEGIQECETIEALSAAVSFPVEELSNLPFTPEEVSYVDYFGEMTQITYRSGDNSVTLRKAHGDEDVSGDYNDYETVREVQTGMVSVVLKGEGESFSLALWQQNGFSYALSFEPGISEQMVMKLVNGISSQ